MMKKLISIKEYIKHIEDTNINVSFPSYYLSNSHRIYIANLSVNDYAIWCNYLSNKHKEYNRKYIDKHRKEKNRKEREKYANDIDYREAKKRRNRESKRKYKEKRSIAAKEYYKKNRDKYIQRAKKYYIDHKKEIALRRHDDWILNKGKRKLQAYYQEERRKMKRNEL